MLLERTRALILTHSVCCNDGEAVMVARTKMLKAPVAKRVAAREENASTAATDSKLQGACGLRWMWKGLS